MWSPGLRLLALIGFYFVEVNMVQGFHYVKPEDYPRTPRQFSVKVEMILPEKAIAEDFTLFWDEELKLARYDHTIGTSIAFNSTRPRKTVVDFENGISFHANPSPAKGSDTNCTVIPLDFLVTEKGTAPPDPQNPKPLVPRSREDIRSAEFLRALDPRHLFDLDQSDRVYNASSESPNNTAIIRGIPCENFWIADNDFYVPGYGRTSVRHNLYFMRKDFVNGVFIGQQRDLWIPVQRVTLLASPGPRFLQKILIVNFYDFTVPTTPTLYDFDVRGCFPDPELSDGVGFLTQSTFQMRFPTASNNITAIQPEAHPEICRDVVKQMVSMGKFSPVQVIDTYVSQDPNYLFITTTFLPLLPKELLFVKTEANRHRGISERYLISNAHGNPNWPLENFTDCLKQLTDYAERIVFCPRLNSNKGEAVCIALDTANSSSVWAPPTSRRTCDTYEKVLNGTGYDSMVAFMAVSRNVQRGNFTLRIKQNGRDVFLPADTLRMDVGSPAFSDDANERPLELRGSGIINPRTERANQRNEFRLYRGESIIIGSGVKERFAKLSSHTCRQRCLDEKRFVCHSTATCIDGTCMTSDLHGDELVNGTGGQTNLQFHSHCMVHTRAWAFGLFAYSRTFPTAPAEATLHGITSADSCAKQCLYGGSACKSFVYCSSDSGSHVTKLECRLHQPHSTMERNSSFIPVEYDPTGCRHYDRSYAKDFHFEGTYELTVAEVSSNGSVLDMRSDRCAEECIDKLGDLSCRSFDICSAPPGVLGSASPDGPVSVCRISNYSVASSLMVNQSVRLRPNENCVAYSRAYYLDGTPMGTPRANSYRNFRDIFAGKQPGFTSSDMAGLAISVLIAAAVVTAVCIVLWRRSHRFKEGSVTFTRLLNDTQ
ncbi:hypothetical protein BV898_13060 [Hypsibius exemplaris]|uniref:LolA-like domain-containing protein n=1 Tax=Hypsibius exemplaris TaxID=2072580 RepID=A0A1W0WBR6_HYPEX|nr:hypothetical protein BV898_13060 [Hypsibius exemplaris]